jgi:hypothetical protein
MCILRMCSHWCAVIFQTVFTLGHTVFLKGWFKIHKREHNHSSTLCTAVLYLLALFPFSASRWLKSLSSHNLSFFNFLPVLPLFLMSSTVSLNHLVLLYPMGLFALNCNSNALLSIVLSNFGFQLLWRFNF